MTEANKTVEVVAETGEIVRKVTPMVKLHRAVSKVTFEVSKHSPLILTGLGIVGLGATAYYAYKSRDKINNIVTHVEIKQDRAARLEEYGDIIANGGTLSKEDSKDLEMLNDMESKGELDIDKALYIRDLAAAVALPITLGVLSATAIGGSYLIQNRRIAGLAGALATTTAEHKYLRDRMEKKYGKEEVERLETVEEKEVTYTDSKGKEKTKKIDVQVPTPVGSMSGRWYADSNEYFADDHQYNLDNLRTVQRALEQKLFVNGFLRFNQVMDALGFDRIKGGEEFGWNSQTGFDMSFQTTNFETTEDIIPQIYVRWTRPISIYHDVEYTGRYSN